MSRNLSYLLFAALILAALGSPAAAQTACPDISGAWSSDGSLTTYCSVDGATPAASTSARVCSWTITAQDTATCTITAIRECVIPDPPPQTTSSTLVTYYTGVVYDNATRVTMQIMPTDPPTLSYNPPGMVFGQFTKTDKKTGRVSEISYVSNAGDQYTRSNGNGTYTSYSCAYSGKGRIFR